MVLLPEYLAGHGVAKVCGALQGRASLGLFSFGAKTYAEDAVCVGKVRVEIYGFACHDDGVVKLVQAVVDCCEFSTQ